MTIFDIKASLGSQPTKIVKPNELLQITRGASAVLTFNYSDKTYTYDDTDQITFMLKQGKTIYWYKMFTYLKPSADIAVIPGKNYYTKVSHPANSFKCTATKILPNYDESPVEQEYYEEVDDNCSWRDTEYLIDDRFHFENLNQLKTVSMILHPEDTIQFKANTGKQIEFEVAVRVNTETLPGFANKDSIIIESQPRIIVTDSLFSQI